MDLEMTGLDPDRCAIVEVATLVTESDLTLVAEGPELVIFQPESELAKMDAVVTTMHTRSGLIERIRASKVSLAEAEQATAAFIAAHVDVGKSPLAGNSVWKDKQFLEKHMPLVVAQLHYRIVDVSTVKELARRWYPDAPPPKKADSHRALEDIKESIAELRHYRSTVFR